MFRIITIKRRSTYFIFCETLKMMFDSPWGFRDNISVLDLNIIKPPNHSNEMQYLFDFVKTQLHGSLGGLTLA